MCECVTAMAMVMVVIIVMVMVVVAVVVVVTVMLVGFPALSHVWCGVLNLPGIVPSLGALGEHVTRVRHGLGRRVAQQAIGKRAMQQRAHRTRSCAAICHGSSALAPAVHWTASSHRRLARGRWPHVVGGPAGVGVPGCGNVNDESGRDGDRDRGCQKVIVFVVELGIGIAVVWYWCYHW